MLLFVLTILSGVYGMLLQNIIPKLTLRILPTETIYSQIDYVAAQNVQDIRRALEASCGPRGSRTGEASVALASEPAVPPRSTIVVGAVREIGLVRGRTLRTQTVAVDAQDREILWDAFEAMEPFLTKGQMAGGPLSRAGEAAKWFSDLRRACCQQSQRIITAMEESYEQRQQFDLQRKLHHWLHAWLPLHIGLSVAVSVLLIVHVITALRYW